MKNTEKYSELITLLELSDNDVRTMLFSFPRYVEKNDLSKLESFNLGLIATEFQYNMRIFRERIAEADKVKYSTSTNNFFLKRLLTYDKLIPFLLQEFIEKFNELTLEEKTKYVIENPNSYFAEKNEINLKRTKEMFNLIDLEK
jgi:hypothetical protein